MSGIPGAVLVAVDFGEASARAIGFGGAIAAACGARLVLLHAETIEAPPYFTRDQIAALEGQREATRAQAERYLSRFGQRHTRTPFSALVDNRQPVDAILKASATADLVVMGTHGHRGLTRWWLGSVAERVLREIGTPLLVVHAGALEATDMLFSRVLVHDGTVGSTGDALEVARALAAKFNGDVFDTGGHTVELMAERVHATSVVAAVPRLKRSAWLSHAGEPLVRSCRVPILFVPEVAEGASV
jgi:nucleotide-binding universal stress UspA family protein